MATIADGVGVRSLARLLASPDQEIPALALVVDGSATLPTSTGQRMLDERAVTELRARIAILQREEALDDSERDELHALTRELGHALGLGARPRSFADAPERARTSVRKAIKRAIEAIAMANPGVGRHFASSVSTGILCCYRPPASAGTDIG